MDTNLAAKVAVEIESALEALGAALRLVKAAPSDDQTIDLQAFLAATAARLHTGAFDSLAAVDPSLSARARTALRHLGATAAQPGGQRANAPPTAAEVRRTAQEVRDIWIETTIRLSETMRMTKGLAPLNIANELRDSTLRTIADVNSLLGRLEAAVPEVKSTPDDYERAHEDLAKRRKTSSEPDE